jgi:hypothetical protein
MLVPTSLAAGGGPQKLGYLLLQNHRLQLLKQVMGFPNDEAQSCGRHAVRLPFDDTERHHGRWLTILAVDQGLDRDAHALLPLTSFEEEILAPMEFASVFGRSPQCSNAWN